MRNTLNAVGELFLSNKLQKIKYLLGLLLCIFTVGFGVTAAPTDLDPAFGDRGLAYSDPSNGQNSRGAGMTLQPDGKIVMVGSSIYSLPTFIVTRYKTDGNYDSTFGSGGKVYGNFGGANQSANAVAVQADGKIVVGGTTYFSSRNDWDLTIMRFNPNGSVDTSFGTNGLVTIGYVGTQVAENYKDYMGAIKIANDGKIIVGGSAVSSGTFHRASLARLNSDGSFDTSFGTGGKVLEEGYGWTDLIVRADGSVATVGYYLQPAVVQMLSCTYNADGVRQSRYVRGIDGDRGYLYGIAEQANGNFIAVGQFNEKVSVIRLGTNGGETFFPDSVVVDGRAVSVAIQPDGKIVISAVLSSSGGYNLIRLNPNGSPDNSFGTNGLFSMPISDTQIIPADIVIQPDGKYLVGGAAQITPPGANLFAMARFRGAGAAPVKAKFDYDGDGKADVSVFRPSENKWYILNSATATVAQTAFGASGDVATPADYDGDGKTDVAIFRPSSGAWWYQSSITGAQRAISWGQSGDIPRPSDFDGDGKTDFIVYRPSNGVWYRLTETGITSIIAFGTSEDKPLIGDFDGDGKTDPAVYRPSTGVWWYASSLQTGAYRAVQFGISTDVPVAADYDGDGKTDFAVYRSSNGGWHILNSSNGSYVAFPFGDANDKPVAADYDGDGKADAGVYRPSNGSWYLLRSTSGFSGVQWGTSADIPTENSFIQ